MKTFKYITILSMTVIALGSCTNKNMELEVWQEGCKKFKLKSEVATYNEASTICDPGTLLDYDIEFKFTKSEDCIAKVVNNATFYDANQNEIVAGAPDYSFYEELDKSEVSFSSSAKRISYPIEFAFANTTDAGNFNHAILDVHTENEIGNQSNVLKMLLFTPCSQVTSDMYSPSGSSTTVNPLSTYFELKLWDDASEDGDIVSVYLNGEWIVWNHSLLNDGTTFFIPTSKLNSGGNDLVVFAVNYGSDWPNTVALSIDGKELSLGEFDKKLTTGKSVKINF